MSIAARNDNNVLSVSLKDEFNARQCFEASGRISKLKGVATAHHLPEGCFGINSHRIYVTHDGSGDVAKEIAKMPEVKSVKPGYNF